MEVYIRKYFWVLGVVVVIACAIMAARGVNHVVEAAVLGDSKTAPKPPPVVRDPTKTKKVKSKVGEPLAKRNMFCGECLPPEPEEPTGPEAGAGVPVTSLPLRVVATNVSTIEKYSFATIMNTDNDKKGSYNVDDEIPDAGKVVRIRGRYVDFRNNSSRRIERIELLGKEAPSRPAVAAAPVRPASPTRGARNEVAEMIDAGVKKDGDTSWEIQRSLVDKVLENPALVARGARIVPSIRNGKPNGFKLYAIRPNSIYAKIGLMNGDTITAINGFELTTADKALEVYTKVREANNLTVNITRRGKDLSHSYSIR